MIARKMFEVVNRVLGLSVVVALTACGLPASDLSPVRTISVDLKRLHRTVIDDQYVGAYPSIVAEQGQLFVSYYVARWDEDEDEESWGGLKYAHRADGVWSKIYVDVPVDGDVGRNTSLVRDSKGSIHISYWDTKGGSLKYAVKRYGASEWKVFTVDTPGHHGRGTSLAIDSNNRIYIAYYGDGAIRLAQRIPKGWRLSRIAEVGEVYMYPSLAVDQKDRLRLVFYDRLNGFVKYAVRKFGSWKIQTVVSVGDSKPAPKLTIDGAGGSHMVFYDTNRGELKYAMQKGSKWQIETLDHVGDIGYDPNLGRKDSLGSTPSLIVDSENNLHLSYYHGAGDDLRYAVRRDGQWVKAVIDSEGDVGRYSTLAIDAQKTVHIVYRDSTLNRLKYASF